MIFMLDILRKYLCAIANFHFAKWWHCHVSQVTGSKSSKFKLHFFYKHVFSLKMYEMVVSEHLSNTYT